MEEEQLSKPLLSEKVTSEDFWQRLDDAAAVDTKQSAAPVSKDEYRQQLGKFAKPEVVELLAPLCAKDKVEVTRAEQIAERNFQQCVKEIEEDIEALAKEYQENWYYARVVDTDHFGASLCNLRKTRFCGY